MAYKNFTSNIATMSLNALPLTTLNAEFIRYYKQGNGET